MLIVWFGEMVRAGTEDEVLEVDFVKTEDEDLNQGK
jgi:hypothetical protein